MGVLSNLRGRLLSPSSRSFHELFAEVLCLHDDVRALRKETAALREEIASLRRGSFGRLAAHDTHFKMMLWPVFARDVEIDVEVKLCFFQEFPQAQGDFRLLRLSCGQLLFGFDGVLRHSYGDYLELPADIHSHFHHVSRELLSEGAMRGAIRCSFSEVLSA